METLISGIIDYVARPSTTDSPVRVIRKTSSESPTCVSDEDEVEVGLASPDSVAQLTPADSDSESSYHTLVDPPVHVRSVSSTSLLSRLSIPATMTPFNNVLTAEGIITGYCGRSCGDCTSCYDNIGDPGTISSENIDAAAVRQFEAAFATFLYKHPAFTSMSHTRLQKLRTKLLRESAKNMKAEKELQKQLAELREAKFNRELELQQELLAVTRAKTAREAEMICLIEKTKRSSMMMDDHVVATNNSCSSLSTLGPSSVSHVAIPSISGNTPSSYEVFQNEIKKNKMEQAHILAEMEKIKMQIAEESVNGTP
ncbi:hypothetical protein ACHAXH_007379 [Discostella pseudostelligera]